MRKIHLLLPLVLIAAPAMAQPTMTSISPTYGGTGPNAAGTWTITGTGFSTAQKATRFVDANNADVFTFASCSSTTTCTAGLRAGRVPTGGVQSVAVYALVNGVKSGSVSNFLYYGPPTITSLVPSSSSGGDASGNVNGGAFTSGSSFPGDTTVILYLFVHDYLSGCASTAQCAFSALSPLVHDCCQSGGAYPLSVYTPGGVASTFFTFGAAPATPTISSIVPASGPAAGGTQTVTITGTNFLMSPVGSTSFTFITHGSFGTSNLATSVSCTSTTTCTAKVPNGGSGGLADVQAQTLCNAAQACASASRSSQGIPGTKVNAYSYTGVTVNPGYGTTLTTSENGQSAQYTVVLNSQPTANVHVAVNGGAAMVPTSGGRATVSATGLDFTPANWNMPQTVTVTGIDDTGTGGAGSAAAPGTGNSGYSVSTFATSTDPNYNNVNGNDQQFTNLDNDSANVYIAPANGLVTTRKGQSATFNIVLTKAPSSPVTIGFTSSDPLEGSVSPTSLVFATTPGGANGWNVVQTVTVNGLVGAAVGRDIPYEIITTLTGADAAYNTLFSNFGVPNVSVTSKDGLPVSADFDHNGRSDLVWRNFGSGQNAIWYMNGLTATGAASFNSAPANWSIVGTGDFDGNGTADIVWRNTVTGENAIWYMTGSSPTTSASFSSAPTDWSIVGIGDFNGDGKPDIVWRNTVNGANAIWYMNNTAIIGGGAFAGATTDWSIVGAADFNGDGLADIVWRNTVNGQDAIWYMNGLNIIGGGAFAGAPASWVIGAVGDFNGDGKADVAWRNTTTGENAIWFMDGLNIIGGGSFNSVPTTWSMVGPR